MMKYKNELMKHIDRNFHLLKTILFCLIFCTEHLLYCQSSIEIPYNEEWQQSRIDDSNDKKVFIHYMGWYGDTIPDSIEGDIKRHWRFGHANTPLIGYYDSKNSSLLTYHLLLSWSCGIDGIIINVKDTYDDLCMKSLIRTIKWIRSIDSANFNYAFGISFDDQGFDLAYPYDTAISKLTYLKDSVFHEMPNYIKYRGRPAMFVFDYPERYLTAGNFRDVVNKVFNSTTPIIIWNSMDDKENSKQFADAFYPWVQPGNKGWDNNGLNWGKEYLDWYYPRVNEINKERQYFFTCGGVWPGFDDRKNISWGGNRLISREKGKVYDSTWEYIFSYKMPLPLDWVVIETWNDWNEGTEIEPSKEEGYRYLVSTIRNINMFKGTTTDEDTLKFIAAGRIYESFWLIENGNLNPALYNHYLEEAVRSYLHQDFDSALKTSLYIINDYRNENQVNTF